MLIKTLYLGNGKVYVNGTGFTGIVNDYPVKFKGATYSRGSKLDIIGQPGAYGVKLCEENTFEALNEVHGAYKIWNINEQVSYFLPDNVYDEWNAPTREPLILSFDFEVGTSSNRFPNAEYDPIILIGYAFNEDSPSIIYHENEADIITEFLNIIIHRDPDITVGYFTKGFDIPYLLTRLKCLDMPFPEELHRIPCPNEYRRDKYNYQDSMVYMSIGFGRTHYDQYDSTRLDTLITTKNRRLKTVAKFLGSDSVFDIEDEQKSSMLELLEHDRDTLYKYLDSDIKQVQFLNKVYLPRISEIINIAHISMDYFVNAKGTAAFARSFVGRSFVKKGIYPVKSNNKRNKELHTGKKYQGAYTGIKQTGVFHNISKVDFSSMYPSLMVTFNISPDTVKYISMDIPLNGPKTVPTTMLGKGAYDDGDNPILIHENTDNHIVLSIPDENVGSYITCRIDKSKKGILPTEIDLLFKMRADTRAIMKKIKDKKSTEWIVLNSKQLGLKIAANSVYGLMGSEYLDVGDMICAMLITALGREITHYTVSLLGKDTVEIDTDGVYVDADADSNELNKKLETAIYQKYPNFPFSQRMTLETEKSGYTGLFIAMKNYALRDPNDPDKVTHVTGSSMKGSGKAKFVEDLLSKSAGLIMDGLSANNVLEIIRKDAHSNQWQDIDFRISMNVRRNEDEYDTDGGLRYRLKRLNKIAKDISIEELKQRIEAEVDKSLASLANEDEKSKEDIMDYLKSRMDNASTKEHVLDAVEFTLQCRLGVIPKRGMSINYRIFMKALDSGVQILSGDSIEYYMAISPEGIELFNRKNIKRYPINMQWYVSAVENNVVDKMLTAIRNQTRVSLF